MKKKLFSFLTVIVLILTMLPVTAMAAGKPGTPSNFKVTFSGSTAKLSWSAVRNSDGYIVSDFYGDLSDPDNFYFTLYDASGTSYSITGLDRSVQHLFAVFAYTETSDDAVLSDPAIFVPAPQVSISKVDGKVKLSWPETGATKYYIYRGTSSSNLSYYASTTKNSYTNSSVTSGTRYYYQVKTMCDLGDETYYSAKSAVKSTIPLSTPKLSASMSNGSAKLSWDAVKGASKYYIYRSTDGTNFKYYSSTAKTSYTNSSVTAGNRYYYKIKAIKSANGTDWTSSYSATKSVRILKAPTLSIAKKDGKVTLSWGAVSGASKYYIYRSTDGKNFKYYASTTKTSYTNSSVTSGICYYYKVKAVDANGGSTKLSALKSTVPVATPVMTMCAPNGNQIKLQWNAVQNAGKYYIYRSTDGTNFKYYASTGKSTYTDTNVVSGQAYSYYVKAIVSLGGTDWFSSPSQSLNSTPIT